MCIFLRVLSRKKMHMITAYASLLSLFTRKRCIFVLVCIHMKENMLLKDAYCNHICIFLRENLQKKSMPPPTRIPFTTGFSPFTTVRVLAGSCLLSLRCQKQNLLEHRKENSYEKHKRKEDRYPQGF